ncbi:ribulose phosphate epimerase [Testudinibacter sp. P80/BLE/0925]|uniref:ribulose phosphate epimerase n=1 Tax=Testudinibacter sp. TW-1 TaxID=3417757 RepID=UPI003D366A59
MKKSKLALIRQLKTQKISTGILASNWLTFAQTLSALKQHHMHLLHFDIADGQFSPLFTVGCHALKQFPHCCYKDVHLMVRDQEKQAKECIKNGATIITLQLEGDGNLTQILDDINSQQAIISGLSLCPDTDLSRLQPYLEQVDLIQILTLDPRTGVKADEFSISTRIKSIINILGEKRHEKILAVDGSMTLALAKKVKQLGIDWVVTGSALFANENLDNTLTQWNVELN